MSGITQDAEEREEGHENLLMDIADLGYEAQNFEFHDFKNKKYATPKVALRDKLMKMAQNVIEGRYD